MVIEGLRRFSFRLVVFFWVGLVGLWFIVIEEVVEI